MSPYEHADSAFRMGASHERSGSPCQDYALAGVAPHPWAAVSDGCSMSGRTDVGARVMALSARRVVKDPTFPELSHDDALARLRERVLEGGRSAALILGLDQRMDLDATLGVAVATPKGAMAFLLGDGVIAARTDRGLYTLTVSWAGNMPAYPSYMLDAERLASFLAASEEAAKEEGRAACTLRHELLGVDGEVLESGTEGLSAQKGIMGVTSHWYDDAPETVAVLTDGVASFGDEAEQGEILAALMDFKGRQGEFVARRMRRVLGDLFKRGLRPGDDISMAAIARPIATP